MKENEAIEKLKNMRLYMQITDKSNDCKFTEDDYKANEMAIQALEEVQQYRTNQPMRVMDMPQTEHLYMMLGFALAVVRDMRLTMMIMITALIAVRK